MNNKKLNTIDLKLDEYLKGGIPADQFFCFLPKINNDDILKKDVDFFRTDIKIEEATIRQDIKLEYPNDYFKTDIKIKES